MPASRAFATKVYDIVVRIPMGRVTTYGRIARVIGDPRGARMVRWARVSTRSQERRMIRSDEGHGPSALNDSIPRNPKEHRRNYWRFPTQ